MQLKDQDCEVLYKKLHFKFLQMPLFNKTENELETHFDKWCYFLKNLESFEEIPAILKEPIFEKAFHISEVGAMSSEEYKIYKENLLAYWESKGMIDTAKKESFEEGYGQGYEKGQKEEALKIAKNLLSLGLSIEEVQKVTGISKEELDELLNS